MKRIIFSLLFMLFALFSNAQLRVDAQGQVGIGSWFGTHNDVGYGNALEVGGGMIVGKWPSSVTFRITNYTNPYGSTTLAFIPRWFSSGYLGDPNHRFYRTYTYYIHRMYERTLSDKSIKENIKEVEPALERILKVRPVSYDIKESFFKDANPDDIKHLVEEGKGSIGVVAQDLQKIFPELVHYNKEAKLFEVSYSSFIPFLIKAIQEQQEEIEILKREGNRFRFGQSTNGKTGIQESKLEGVKLYQNSPNPFSKETKIQFDLPKGIKDAFIMVTDMRGQQVLMRNVTSDNSEITIKKGKLNPGLFFYTFVVDGLIVDTKQMVLTK